MTVWLVVLARSARFLGPLAALLLLLLLVYLYEDNPVRDSYGSTALYLVPIAAWMTLALLDATDPQVRELAAVRRGRLRTDAERVAAALVVVAALAVLAVAAPAAAGAFERAPTAGDLAVGLLAHLACGAIGVGLAACAARPVVARPAVGAAAIAGALLVLVVLGAPPMSLLDALHDDGPTAGPLIAAGALGAALVAAALALMGRRE